MLTEQEIDALKPESQRKYLEREIGQFIKQIGKLLEERRGWTISEINIKQKNQNGHFVLDKVNITIEKV